MNQRIVAQTGEGYYTHNTGGEHALRISGDEHHINRLRQMHGLETRDFEAFEYAFRHDGYVMVRPDNDADSSTTRPEICAYVLARRTEENPYNYGYSMDDLLVHQDYRGRGLGKFLLGKLAEKGSWSSSNKVFHPDSITAPLALLDDETKSWLASRGFSEEDDVMRLLLPGTGIEFVPENRLYELLRNMPEEWNGTITVTPADEHGTGYTDVYRSGTHVAQVRHTPNTEWQFETIDGTEYSLKCYDIFTEAGQTTLGFYTSSRFAIIDLLNPRG